MRSSSIKRTALAATLGAVSFILIYFNFSVPFLSPFAEFDLSALPEILGGYILGPVGALEVILIKLLLKLLVQGSESMLVGEVQNIILSTAYVLPSVIYYRRHKTKKGAALGLVFGGVTSVIVSVFTNIFLIFPFYMKLFQMDWDGIINMYNAVNPMINNIPAIIALSILPFNIISRTVVSVIAFFTYKKISIPLKKMIL